MNEFEKDFKFVMTETLRQRFCKDMNLSIKIFEDPYFANFLKLYDEQYGAVAKYNRFVSAVMQFGCEQDYFEAYNKLKDEVIEYLNNNPEMAFFAKEEDMSKFVCQNKGYPTKKHLEAILEYGILPEHKRIYGPVKNYIENHK